MTHRVRGGRPGRVREALVGYGFVIAPMAVFGVFFLFPIGYAIYISRYNWGVFGPDPAKPSAGWHNYGWVLHDPLFWRSMRNIGEFAGEVVPAQMALGLFMAIIVNQKIRARSFFRSGDDARRARRRCAQRQVHARSRARTGAGRTRHVHRNG